MENIMPQSPEPLDEFLKRSDVSLFREAMFRHQLMHEIYLICAHRRRNVHMYEPEIDVSGFDLVIDDLKSTLRFQIKSKMNTSTSSSWEIHKVLLRPNNQHLDSLPFVPDGGGVGYMGGVILITATITNKAISYIYSYTDALVICAMQQGIGLSTQNMSLRRSVETVFDELTQPDYEPGKMTVPETVFWKFPSLQRLLDFAGFYPDTTRMYRHNLHRALSQLYYRQPEQSPFRSREDARSFATRLIEEMLGRSQSC